MACHTGVIVSQELTARKASFTREREATKQTEALRVEMVKLCKEMDELNKTIISKENLLSQARVDVRVLETRAKMAEERADTEAAMRATNHY